MGEIKTHKDLKVWQKSIELVMLVYSLTKQYPKEELYAMTNQIRRCVTSIPANIAEGSGRKNKAEFMQFLYIFRLSKRIGDISYYFGKVTLHNSMKNIITVQML